MASNANAMEILARKAEGHNGFIGAVLNAIADAKQTTVADVASSIGCSSENLPRLALCKMPRDTAEHFAADVRQVSKFVGCDAGQLANVVREYRAISAMRRYDPDDSNHDTMLMAARDKKGEDDGGSEDSE